MRSEFNRNSSKFHRNRKAKKKLFVCTYTNSKKKRKKEGAKKIPDGI
jgi:hypothetical protein